MLVPIGGHGRRSFVLLLSAMLQTTSWSVQGAGGAVTRTPAANGPLTAHNGIVSAAVAGSPPPAADVASDEHDDGEDPLLSDPLLADQGRIYCADRPVGHYTDPGRVTCARWLYCDGAGRHQWFRCPDGTFFHEAAKACDFYDEFVCLTAEQRDGAILELAGAPGNKDGPTPPGAVVGRNNRVQDFALSAKGSSTDGTEPGRRWTADRGRQSKQLAAKAQYERNLGADKLGNRKKLHLTSSRTKERFYPKAHLTIDNPHAYAEIGALQNGAAARNASAVDFAESQQQRAAPENPNSHRTSLTSGSGKKGSKPPPEREVVGLASAPDFDPNSIQLNSYEQYKMAEDLLPTRPNTWSVYSGSVSRDPESIPGNSIYWRELRRPEPLHLQVPNGNANFVGSVRNELPTLSYENVPHLKILKAANDRPRRKGKLLIQQAEPGSEGVQVEDSSGGVVYRKPQDFAPQLRPTTLSGISDDEDVSLSEERYRASQNPVTQELGRPIPPSPLRSEVIYSQSDEKQAAESKGRRPVVESSPDYQKHRNHVDESTFGSQRQRQHLLAEEQPTEPDQKSFKSGNPKSTTDDPVLLFSKEFLDDDHEATNGAEFSTDDILQSATEDPFGPAFDNEETEVDGDSVNRQVDIPHRHLEPESPAQYPSPTTSRQVHGGHDEVDTYATPPHDYWLRPNLHHGNIDPVEHHQSTSLHGYREPRPAYGSWLNDRDHRQRAVDDYHDVEEGTHHRQQQSYKTKSAHPVRHRPPLLPPAPSVGDDGAAESELIHEPPPPPPGHRPRYPSPTVKSNVLPPVMSFVGKADTGVAVTPFAEHSTDYFPGGVRDDDDDDGAVSEHRWRHDPRTDSRRPPEMAGHHQHIAVIPGHENHAPLSEAEREEEAEFLAWLQRQNEENYRQLFGDEPENLVGVHSERLPTETPKLNNYPITQEHFIDDDGGAGWQSEEANPQPGEPEPERLPSNNWASPVNPMLPVTTEYHRPPSPSEEQRMEADDSKAYDEPVVPMAGLSDDDDDDDEDDDSEALGLEQREARVGVSIGRKIKITPAPPQGQRHQVMSPSREKKSSLSSSLAPAVSAHSEDRLGRIPKSNYRPRDGRKAMLPAFFPRRSFPLKHSQGRILTRAKTGVNKKPQRRRSSVDVSA